MLLPGQVVGLLAVRQAEHSKSASMDDQRTEQPAEPPSPSADCIDHEVPTYQQDSHK